LNLENRKFERINLEQPHPPLLHFTDRDYQNVTTAALKWSIMMTAIDRLMSARLIDVTTVICRCYKSLRLIDAMAVIDRFTTVIGRLFDRNCSILPLQGLIVDGFEPNDGATAVNRCGDVVN
jgi:hypothetical protein